MENRKILNIENLNKYFKSRGVLKHVLNDINFSVDEGDFYGIIGESGSGKTTLGKTIIRLIEGSGGNIYFLNRNISNRNISKMEKQWITNNIQMIFQDPLSSLNPNMNIIKLISEPLEINKEIVKKVKEVIQKKVIFNAYYKHDFLLKTKKVFLENTVKFYEGYNRILNNQIKKSGNFKFSDRNSWVTSYNEAEKIYEDILGDQKILIQYFENIIEHNSTVLEKMIIKLENKELDKDFIEYYNFKNNQKILLKPVEEIKNALIKEIDDLNTFKEELKKISEKKLLKNEFKDNYFNYKFNSTNSKLSKTKIDYLKFKLLADKSKIKNHLLSNIFKYKYVDEIKCKNLIKEIFLYIEKIYHNSDLKFKEINSKENYLKNLNYINEKFSIKSILIKINKIYEKKIKPELLKIDSLEKQKNLSIINKKSNKIYKLKKDYKNLLFSMKTKIKKDSQKQKIEEKKILSNVSSSSEKFKLIYKNFLKNEFITFNLKINDLKKQNKKLKKEIDNIANHRLGLLINLRPENLKEFNLKEKHILLTNNKKTFKNQMKLKRSSTNTIDWEFNNTIENTKIYENLFSNSKFILSLNKMDLIKLLTLEKIYKSLESVGLKKEHAYRYPHEFSGGQRQRIVIARALITKPKLIIADEAISALDVSVQAQVINIMKNFALKENMTFLFIAHDLSMVRNICNKVIIMHNGRIVEKGLVSKIFDNPVHPYTIALFKAIPEVDKMHVDLAMFNVNHDYDEHYNSYNAPKFYEISPGHKVLATEKQYQKWIK